MKTIRYAFLMLFVLAPALAVAQDSVHVVQAGTEYPAYLAAFTPSFTDGVTFGPETIVQVDDGVDVGWDACTALTDESAAAVNGNIALVTRGACAFVIKVANASAAGAIAVVTANSDQDEPDDFIVQGGTYVPGDHDIPAVMVSYNSGQSILEGLLFGDDEVTIEPKRIAPVPSAGVVDNAKIETAIFETGQIGQASGYLGAPGFAIDGDNGLYQAGFVAGRVSGEDTLFAGDPYGTGWEGTSLVAGLEGPFDAPFTGFDQGYTSSFQDTDLGISVVGNAYAMAGMPYVIFSYEISNISGGDIEDLYVGMFGDYDVGDFAKNLGFYNEENKTIYAYDSSEVSTNYFGTTVVSDMDVSGWTLQVDGSGSDASIYTGLTNGGGFQPGEDQVGFDNRSVLGVGPISLSSESMTVTFAIVAGEDEATLFTNAVAAQNSLGSVATETTTPEGFYSLEGAYPNPVTSVAKIGFDVPTSQRATLKVYDVLGREVATLVDRVVAAGPQEVSFDATNLPSGVYLYRLEAGEVQLMQRITVVR